MAQSVPPLDTSKAVQVEEWQIEEHIEPGKQKHA